MLTVDGKAVTGKDRCEECQYFKLQGIDYGSGKYGVVCENEGLCNRLEKVNNDIK